jgi:hypothetical protein
MNVRRPMRPNRRENKLSSANCQPYLRANAVDTTLELNLNLLVRGWKQQGDIYDAQ